MEYTNHATVYSNHARVYSNHAMIYSNHAMVYPNHAIVYSDHAMVYLNHAMVCYFQIMPDSNQFTPCSTQNMPWSTQSMPWSSQSNRLPHKCPHGERSSNHAAAGERRERARWTAAGTATCISSDRHRHALKPCPNHIMFYRQAQRPRDPPCDNRRF